MATVEIRPPEKPMFVGTYAPLDVWIDPASGLGVDDLDFVVEAGMTKGGIVSTARDRVTPKDGIRLRLLAGATPGRQRVLALARGTEDVVGEAEFAITDQWLQDGRGPSRWFFGRVEGTAPAGTWGGGGAGPQNLRTVPAPARYRVAVVLVDTASQRYPADATVQTARDRWNDQAFRGVTTDGVAGRSVAAFFNEASGGRTLITGDVFGPFNLPGNWDQYFELVEGWAWRPKGGFDQSCVTAADGTLNYRDWDAMVFVTPRTPWNGADQHAWPYGWVQSLTTAEGNRTLGIVSMANEWGIGSNRHVYETLAHELGHTLRLGDMYTPIVPGRNPTGWDMMDEDDYFPHFSLGHRMMLGWADAGWIEPFDFARAGGPVDRTISLSPIERGEPPAGRKAGIEVRLADGWNYYFEYRTTQATQIADRNLPQGGRVLGTDVVSQPYNPPVARPGILLLRPDSDGDGAVLANGDDYAEIDRSSYPTQFRVDVSGIDGDKADVRIRYGVNDRPDPSIRPWPASRSSPWQSPDIEIRNARSAADAAWRNVLWIGMPNTIVAKVTNRGRVDAPDVQVEFSVKDFNVGGAPETFLSSVTRTIPAGATVEFEAASWTPPREGHFCVVARIPLYATPTGVVEMTELNNLAQSNYDRLTSRRASPPTREAHDVRVSNPYDRPAWFAIVPAQSNPLYRTYIEHTSLRLDPGESRAVRVEYEYAYPNARERAQLENLGALKSSQIKKLTQTPNNVSLVGMLEDPRGGPAHAYEVAGGAGVQVTTGRETAFKHLDHGESVLAGTVVTVDDDEPVKGGMVFVGLGLEQGDDTVSAELVDGRFAAELPSDWSWLQAYYLPSTDLADCWSERIER